MLKQFSYSGHPVAITVKIHDQDVTDDLAALDDIGQGIDYPNLTEFRVGEANFLIRDVQGDFSPNNPSNFFTRNGGRRTGRNSPIEIEAGFIVNGTRHTETVFKGTILRLVQDASGATVKVVCTDNFGDMRNKTITNFGIDRHFRLLEELTQSSENGAYPIMQCRDAGIGWLCYFGNESVRRGPITPVQKLENGRYAQPTQNFVIVDAEGVRTEGGPITNAQNGYPQLRMKSPYRYRHIKDVISDILTQVSGITKSDISDTGAGR